MNAEKLSGVIEKLKNKARKGGPLTIILLSLMGAACSSTSEASASLFPNDSSVLVDTRQVTQENASETRKITESAVHEYAVDFDGKICITGNEGSQVKVQINSDRSYDIANYREIEIFSGDTIYITPNGLTANYTVSFAFGQPGK